MTRIRRKADRRSRVLAALSGIILASLCVESSLFAGRVQDFSQQQNLNRDPISVLPIPLTGEFEDAVEKDALAHACARQMSVLRKFFEERELLFDTRLLWNDEQGRYCHIYYRPSIPGFRADPDDWPVTELVFDVNSLGFLSLRTGQYGDALDISKRILSELVRPLSVTIGVTGESEEKLRLEALKFHFPNTRHDLELRPTGSTASANHWVQDHLKMGRVSGKRRVLVTRRLFESDPSAGCRHQPLLASYSESQFVRSNLSWDGGDLQFALHPKQKDKLILFCGYSAREYWGSDLALKEYLYVLKLEFGADYVVDFGDLASHVDYFAAFLPGDNIALVSDPLRENFEVALAALELLKDRGNRPQIPEVGQLWTLLKGTPAEIKKRQKDLVRILRSARQESANWLMSANSDLEERLAKFAAEKCPETPQECFTLGHALSLRGEDPRLMADWVAAYSDWWTKVRLADCVLAIVASQLPGSDHENRRRIEQKANELKKLGFQVIRVPRIAGDPKIGIPWSGITYVNALLIDDLLFVPRFGLGRVEDAIFEDLDASLPDHYSVVPVYARQAIVHNGGVHCTVGIGRKPVAAPTVPKE